MAYTFLRIEMLWNRCLYGGLVKLHRAEAGIARRVVDKQHLTREGFQKLFNVVYGAAPDGKEDFKKAETIRDRVIHGKDVEPADLRYAIGEAIDHATALIAQVQTIAGLNLGDMRGYKTKIEPLDRRTTKWVLKGMGFAARA